MAGIVLIHDGKNRNKIKNRTEITNESKIWYGFETKTRIGIGSARKNGIKIGAGLGSKLRSCVLRRACNTCESATLSAFHKFYREPQGPRVPLYEKSCLRGSAGISVVENKLPFVSPEVGTITHPAGALLSGESALAGSRNAICLCVLSLVLVCSRAHVRVTFVVASTARAAAAQACTSELLEFAHTGYSSPTYI
ncbi:hypothetical protein EVAR_8488_1 [Eumeta japonica]|uniref:Uncharacterized protein n=1 Tax=Eumeta variegata TaxID=151549 RepID=A0A4C1XPG9_EUMVA|nr:hypothetical protein EVAR_8488_1 [Eumeta japonica]